jgi:hypothetical protein
VSDDGVRMWVNGNQIINNWQDQAPTESSGTVTLEAGKKYDVRVEYYQGAGGAVMQLFWHGPGQSREVIPQSQLYSDRKGASWITRLAITKRLKANHKSPFCLPRAAITAATRRLRR